MTDPGQAPSKGKILVVDDDAEMRNSIRRILLGEGYSVFEAQDGISCIALLGIEKVDMILSDIKMPNMHGVEMLHRIKQLGPHPPVVLMTGFSNILEAAEAHDIGATDFLSKPFSRDELLTVVRETVAGPKDASSGASEGADESEAQRSLDLDYCKISIGDFASGSQIRYPIYVRISETKYIKVAHSGEDLSSDRIKKFRQLNVPYLYLKKDDYREFVSMSAQMSDQIVKTDRSGKDRKIQLLRQTTEILLEYSFFQEVDELIVDSAKAHLESIFSLVSDNNKFLDALTGLMHQPNRLYAHSVGVSVISGMIGNIKGWKSAPIVSKLMMGGLFHDIGKKDLPQELLEKSPQQLSRDELMLLDTHPEKGLEILSKIGSIPGDVIQAVYQHHESWDGTGFPQRLKHEKIHRFARVISVANGFLHYIDVASTATGKKRGVREALEQVALNAGSRYEAAIVTGLCDLFRMELPDTDPEFLALKSLVNSPKD